MRLDKEELSHLIFAKLTRTSLRRDVAKIVTDALVWADMRGIHSHGAIRMEYYVTRIMEGGTNTDPQYRFTATGSASGIFDGDGGPGHGAAYLATEEGIKQAKETGVSVIGVKGMGHTGALSYYAELAARANLVALIMCVADPMSPPYGGSEAYYGTNPIAVAAKGADGRIMMADLSTTEKSWGGILDARARKVAIPPTWALDSDGNPTTDPRKAKLLLPLAGAKGYCLQMMVDLLSGILLGVPSGKHVDGMFPHLDTWRNLGQLHILIDPARFGDPDAFAQTVTRTMEELSAAPPAEIGSRVYYPGERGNLRYMEAEKYGIEIADSVYDYLKSDRLESRKFGKRREANNH